MQRRRRILRRIPSQRFIRNPQPRQRRWRLPGLHPQRVLSRLLHALKLREERCTEAGRASTRKAGAASGSGCQATARTQTQEVREAVLRNEGDTIIRF